MKKYEFTGEILDIGGKFLNRIKALKDFSDVKAGDLGGWIEKEENLSHKGDCWVYNEAMVRDEASVTENAKIYNNSKIYGKAMVHEDAVIYNDVKIYETAEIYGRAVVCERAEVYGRAKVSANCTVYGDTRIYENAWVCGRAKVYGFSKIHKDAEICENSVICENAEISGTAKILGDVVIGKDAVIESIRDYIFVGPIGSRNRIAKAFKTNDGVKITIGCFYGNIEEFEEKVRTTHKDNIYGKEYTALAEVLKIRFNNKIPQNGGARCIGGE